MTSVHSLPVSRRQALVALGGAAAAPLAFAQVQDLNDAVNKAGRQRMLSQRMVKAWLAIGQQVEPTRAEKVLADSLALFDRSWSSCEPSRRPAQSAAPTTSWKPSGAR
ncbi:MAG TPA: type IV pili methyl-accepting chemotaxis transducer N-terminal domain-containing protein [Ideonella sp.]|nr:type IV pili methyl-accepting chemotaxis transducer N-terminal domain-containing protein [Ideonella sp.]